MTSYLFLIKLFNSNTRDLRSNSSLMKYGFLMHLLVLHFCTFTCMHVSHFSQGKVKNIFRFIFVKISSEVCLFYLTLYLIPCLIMITRRYLVYHWIFFQVVFQSSFFCVLEGTQPGGVMKQNVHLLPQDGKWINSKRSSFRFKRFIGVLCTSPTSNMEQWFNIVFDLIWFDSQMSQTITASDLWGRRSG